MPISKYTPKDIQRFWSKVAITANDNLCWEWQAGCYTEGYGKFSMHGIPVRASRVAYELANGYLQANLLVLHSCDNPKCVNPKHLFTGTQKDNMQDMLTKGRQGWQPSKRQKPLGGRYGETRIDSKLTNAQVVEIINKAANGISQRQLAKEYGVSQPLIWKIINRKLWKQLDL